MAPFLLPRKCHLGVRLARVSLCRVHHDEVLDIFSGVANVALPLVKIFVPSCEHWIIIFLLCVCKLLCCFNGFIFL